MQVPDQEGFSSFVVSFRIEGELCGSSPPRSKVPRPRTPQSPLLTLLSCSPIVLVVEGLNLKGLLNEVVPLEGELSKGPCRSWSLTKTARLRYQCKDRTGSLKLAPNKGGSQRPLQGCSANQSNVLDDPMIVPTKSCSALLSPMAEAVHGSTGLVSTNLGRRNSCVRGKRQMATGEVLKTCSCRFEQIKEIFQRFRLWRLKILQVIWPSFVCMSFWLCFEQFSARQTDRRMDRQTEREREREREKKRTQLEREREVEVERGERKGSGCGRRGRRERRIA